MPSLPPSKIDKSAYPAGVNGMADFLAARLAELQQQHGEATCPKVQKAIRKQAKLVRDMLRWCKSRVGYVD